MNRIEIEQWLRQSILSSFSAEIINSLEPCGIGGERPDGAGNSFLVLQSPSPGIPKEDHESPNYIPMGQIDCGELPPLKDFPTTGVLQFSVIGGDEIWEAPKFENAAVRYLEEPLPPASHANRLHLSFTTGESIDRREPEKFVSSPGWHFETYFDFCSAVFKSRKRIVQVGGIPDPRQDFMEHDLEEIAPGIGKWTLLACFDDANHLDIGPAYGRYFFWIPHTDLRDRRFDRVLVIHQT